MYECDFLLPNLIKREGNPRPSDHKFGVIFSTLLERILDAERPLQIIWLIDWSLIDLMHEFMNWWMN